MTEVGHKRFEEIVKIRRSGRNNLRQVLRTGSILLRIVGFRGLFPFARTVVGLRGGAKGDQRPSRSALDAVERIALDLIEEKFGPRVSLVTVHEPAIALEFDRDDQLKLLLEYAGRNRPPNLERHSPYG